jgi:hypothetical protein
MNKKYFAIANSKYTQPKETKTVIQGIGFGDRTFDDSHLQIFEKNILNFSMNRNLQTIRTMDGIVREFLADRNTNIELTLNAETLSEEEIHKINLRTIVDIYRQNKKLAELYIQDINFQENYSGLRTIHLSGVSK